MLGGSRERTKLVWKNDNLVGYRSSAGERSNCPGATAGEIKTSTARVLASCTYAILQGKESVVIYGSQCQVW